MTSRSFRGISTPSLETISETLALSSMCALAVSLVAGVLLADFDQTRYYRLIVLASALAVVAGSGIPGLKRRGCPAGTGAAALSARASAVLASSLLALHPL